MAVVPAKVSGHTFSRDNVHTYVVDCIIVAPPHAEVHTHTHTYTHTHTHITTFIPPPVSPGHSAEPTPAEEAD